MNYRLKDGGYFDAEGKVHYFVTDYQGNVVEDRKARGAVVASTHYYPYGEPWTEPAGDNDRWFGGKKRLAAEGLPMSDFGPRLLNHAFPAWLSQDRKLEDYYHLSPYSYCAGNPIRYIDPTGAEFTESAKDAVSRLTIWSLIMMSNEKDKEKYNAYKGVLYELSVLRNSDQLYDVNNASKGTDKGSTTYNIGTNAVNIALPGAENGDIILLSHEFKHAYQFETSDLDLAIDGIPSKKNRAYDTYDEQEAYDREILFKVNAKGIQYPGMDYIIENYKSIYDFKKAVYDTDGLKEYGTNPLDGLLIQYQVMADQIWGIKRSVA